MLGLVFWRLGPNYNLTTMKHSMLKHSFSAYAVKFVLLETCLRHFGLWSMQGRETRRREVREKEGIWFPGWSLEQISEGGSMMMTHFLLFSRFLFYSSWLVASALLSICNFTVETFYHLLVTLLWCYLNYKSAIKFCSNCFLTNSC